MENCVLQCDTTGVIVRTSARLTMNMCDLYGSKVRPERRPSHGLLETKTWPCCEVCVTLEVMLLLVCVQGAGVEIYPGSVCSLVGNGIHHCKDGILIKVR